MISTMNGGTVEVRPTVEHTVEVTVDGRPYTISTMDAREIVGALRDAVTKAESGEVEDDTNETPVDPW